MGLWMVDYGNVFYHVDETDGTLIDSWTHPPAGFSHINDIDYYNGQLWACGPTGNRLTALDTDGTLVDEQILPDAIPRGLVWVNDQLWISVGDGNTLLQINPGTGEELDFRVLTGNISNAEQNVSTLTHHGDDIFGVSGSVAREIVGTFTLADPSNEEVFEVGSLGLETLTGVTTDGTSFWLYAFEIATGDLKIARTDMQGNLITMFDPPPGALVNYVAAVAIGETTPVETIDTKATKRLDWSRWGSWSTDHPSAPSTTIPKPNWR